MAAPIFPTMKTSFLIAVIGACMALLPAANASDSVRVEAKLSTDHDDPKGEVDEVVKKKLTVTLTGAPALQAAVLTVVATFYADDLTADKLVVEKEVQSTATLERGRAVVDLPEVVYRYTPTHGKITGSGRRSKAKRIPASGNRYHGWAVQVLDGQRVLGQAFSNNSIQKLLQSTSAKVAH